MPGCHSQATATAEPLAAMPSHSQLPAMSLGHAAAAAASHASQLMPYTNRRFHTPLFEHID